MLGIWIRSSYIHDWFWLLNFQHTTDYHYPNRRDDRQHPLTLTRNVSEVQEFFEIDIETEQIERSTQRMHNTFGWTRIDVLSMMVVCIFLFSLCFSALVEALQTIVHLDHAGDAMHYPLYVLLLGIFGIILNIICYLMIGGFTFHQGSFLSLNEKGDVMLETIVSGEKSIRQGQKRLSRGKPIPVGAPPIKRRQSGREMGRDMSSKYDLYIWNYLHKLTQQNFQKKFPPRPNTSQQNEPITNKNTSSK